MFFCRNYFLRKGLTNGELYDILLAEQRKREMRCTPLIWHTPKHYAENKRAASCRAFIFMSCKKFCPRQFPKGEICDTINC